MESLAGPILVGLISFLAITRQGRVLSDNISKQITEQIDADRDQRFWNIRLDAIIELHSLFVKTSDSLVLGRIQEVNDRIYPVIMNISTLFKNEDFIGKAKEAYDILVKATDRVQLPDRESKKYADLIIETIDEGLTVLGAFK